jgi:hypothetical protein
VFFALKRKQVVSEMLCNVLWYDKEVLIITAEENYVKSLSKIYITKILNMFRFVKEKSRNYKL